MPYVSVDDFKLGMDSRKPRVAGIPGSLTKLLNGHITRGGFIQRSKKFVSKFVLPVPGDEVTACGRFGVTAGTASAGVNKVTSITVNSVEILGADVDWITDNATTAAAIAAQINTFTSSPDHTATSSGASVTVIAEAGLGDTVNGWAFAASVGGDVVLGGDSLYDSVVALGRFEGTDGALSFPDDAGGCGGEGVFTFVGAADGEIDTAVKKFGVSSGIFGGGTSQTAQLGSGDDFDFGSGDFCVEFQAEIDTAKIASGTNTFVSSWSQHPSLPNKKGWIVQWASGTLTFRYSTTGADSISVSVAQAISANTFHHFAVARDGNVLRMFFDGVKIYDAAFTATLFNPTYNLDVGAFFGASSSFTLQGHVDDLRVTKGNPRYTAAFTAPTKELEYFLPVASVVFAGGVTSASGSNATFGLHRQGDNLFVFGGYVEPAGIPSGLLYQRLAHKDNPTTTQITKILDTENFDGKIYAIAEFVDGTIYHYYDGSRVTAWDSVAAAVSSNDTVADALKTKIDLDPDFAASVSTNVVTIEAAVAGVGFSISATAQNFGAVNDQVIDLVQTVANDAGGAEVLATGTVTITGGTNGTVYTGSINLASGGGGSVDTLTINGVDAMDSTPVAFNGTLAQTATDVATEINGNTTSPNYTAVAVDTVVSVSSIVDVHPNPDTFVVAGTSTTIVLDTEVALTGGTHNMIGEIKVDGILVNDNHVPYNTSNSTTAVALATEIGNTTSSPNYTAAAVGSVVTITAIAGTGSGPNSFVVSKTVEGDLTAGVTNMQGGSASGSAAKEKWTATISGTFEPADNFTITLDSQDFVVQGAASATGTTALTFKKKVYSTASSFLYFCAINNPTEWEQPAIGAGYINFSNQDSGSETLNATGIYQGNIGVFSGDVTQIEFVDVDENLNAHLHTARNTGTVSHRSVVQFGNNNLFYLDELSGVRSMQQRDSSGSPQVDDVGTPIDDHLQAFMASVTEQEVADAVGLISVDGRYWIAIKNRIYVFSFFKASKISAWSYYEPVIGDIDAIVRRKKNVYVRANDIIYLYGGDAGTTYPGANETNLEIDLPFLDLDKSAHYKTLTGFDMGAVNTFEINILVNPDDETVESNEFTLEGITYPNSKSGLALRSSHFAPKLVCSSAGAAELYNLAVHYSLDEAS